MVSDCLELIEKIRASRSRWAVLEHFKSAFGASSRSSSEDWAQSDLWSAAEDSAKIAPVFIEALYDGCERLREGSTFVPEVRHINAVLARHNVGYLIQPPDLLALEQAAPPIEIPPPSPTLSERARAVLEGSLQRSEELLRENRPREAVQEILWLLETVTTAFRNVETRSGRVEGKYFNKIVSDLRNRHAGKTLDRILDWIMAMHGYLSAPAGGGIRHGMDLNEGVDIDANQALLFCNLTRSYIGYLVQEHDALTRDQR